ncbi:hypothetical protein BD413DRAFT_722215 [Trametes elegans]|nr:hypothetical protein BD413DRAFT_722215 [Trametes elegans]
MAALILSKISLGGTLGVMFLGVCVSSMLYGVTCLQTFMYYRSTKGKSDGSFFRTLTQGIAGLSISVATELMISSSVAYYLYSRRTGLQRSNDIITKLIALTITTGMLTTLFNVADLIAYITARDDLYVLFFNFMLGKLYANSLLSSLNSREYLMGMADGRTPAKHEAFKLGPMGGSSGQSDSPSQDTQPGAMIHIGVDRYVVSASDVGSTTKIESV